MKKIKYPVSKNIQLILLFTIINTYLVFGQNNFKQPFQTTKYLEFYSDYWINLHHFLYQKASNDQVRKLKQRHLKLIDLGEQSIFNSLNTSEKLDIENAISYYRNNVINKTLLRELANERVWLQQREEATKILDTSISKAYTDILNDASTVYRKHFWQIHNKQNQEVIKHHIQVIEELELELISKISDLSMTEWPSKTKVRVDISAYANHAGAYTPTRPKFNLFLSSLDPKNRSTSFIETLFHEASHLIFRYKGTFRTEL